MMASCAGDEKRKTACVTGGNGYIGSALIKMLLKEGYAVKTTVRNPDDMAKNSHFKGLQELGPLTVLRADMDEEGSLDDAVAGCDYAFLVAAPVNLWAKDPEFQKEVIFSLLACVWPMADRADRAVRPSNAERDEVVREGRDGAARDPHLVGGRSLHEAGPARRRARAGRGVLVRRRVPQSQQAANLGILRVQGAAGERSEQVRGGARHQPGHRLPRHHRGRRAGTKGPHQHHRQPLHAVRRRGRARRAQGHREDLRRGAAGPHRRPLPRRAVPGRGGGGRREVHLLRPQHDRRRARAFPSAKIPAVQRQNKFQRR